MRGSMSNFHPTRPLALLPLLVGMVLALAQTGGWSARAESMGNDSSGRSGSSSIRRIQKISLTVRDTDIAEVMELLSKKERVNILLSKDVSGTVSVNLYDVDLDHAIRAIASAAGYAVERRGGTYFVVAHDQVGKYADGGLTELRTFKVQYSEPSLVESILKNHLSSYGKITTMPDRKLLVIEDLPQFLKRAETLLRELDKQPRQLLIEAMILEITLTENETFGIDWTYIFKEGSFGVKGLSNPVSPGFFLQVTNPDVEVFLDALMDRGRVRTLSTPKLLALESEEAEVVVGDRLGYRLTTTINQVTSESVEFLESGIILKVRPYIDGQGRVMLEIHPEVSTGKISATGLPNQATTEVTTQLLVETGQTVFIGGLIKSTITESRKGVPVLGDIPVLGRLFSRHEKLSTNTETVVLITPHLIKDRVANFAPEDIITTGRVEKSLTEERMRLDGKLMQLMGNDTVFEARSWEEQGQTEPSLRLDRDLGEPVP